MSATIRDVARHAGVSVKTVSRVINNEPLVRDETRDKVQQVIRELGFIPNISAQRLARGRSGVLCLVFYNVSWNYITDLQRGMLEAAAAEGYEILIHPCNIERADELEAIMTLTMQRRVDGFVFVPPCDNATGVLQKLQALQTPFVLISPRAPYLPTAPSVAAQDYQGAYAMTQHLITLGHRRIGFITGPLDHQPSLDRLAGFRAALAAHTIPFDGALLQHGTFLFASGLTAASHLLEYENRPTAIFASNDDMAVGVLHAAYQRGLHVPNDLSIVGFDDSQIAQQVWPSLTTVQQPSVEMARRATRMLVALLQHDPLDERHHHLATSLCIRGSSGPAPPHANSSTT